MTTKYYEVECAVFRQEEGKLLEIMDQKTGEWRKYTGDIFRVFRNSNPMTLDEVRPYMDVDPKDYSSN